MTNMPNVLGKLMVFRLLPAGLTCYIRLGKVARTPVELCSFRFRQQFLDQYSSMGQEKI